jgi:hypothetical protein
LAAPLAGAFAAVLDRAGEVTRAADEPRLVKPGSLGHWSAEPA